MTEVRLLNSFVLNGELMPVSIVHAQIAQYRHIQLEVFDTAVRNPSARLGFSQGVTASAAHSALVQIDSAYLSPGSFEVCLVRLHEPTEVGLAE